MHCTFRAWYIPTTVLSKTSGAISYGLSIYEMNFSQTRPMENNADLYIIKFNVKIQISTKTETDLITTLVAAMCTIQYICILFVLVCLGRIKLTVVRTSHKNSCTGKPF